MCTEGDSQLSSRHSDLGTLAAAPLVAARFLTVLPVPVPGSAAVGPMGWAVASFPLVGAAIGGLLAAADRLLSPWLPPSLAAALLLAALLAVTGALHLDGLMDSFDGIFGGRDRASRLSIMRDSRVGSYGIAAGGVLLLTEYGALVSLPVDGRGAALVLALALSRWAMVATLWALPAAGPGGLAAGLKPQVRWPHLAAGTLVATGLTVATAGWVGVGAGLAAGALLLLGGRLVVSRVGGVTGDTCGGLGQLVEAAVLVACVAAAVGGKP